MKKIIKPMIMSKDFKGEKNIEEKLNYIFDVFSVEEGDEKNICKGKIYKHHYKEDIIDCLIEYIGLFGCVDNVENKSRREYIRNHLLFIHSPILVDIELIEFVSHQYFGKEYWREWNIREIFCAYEMLVSENPQWLDYYTSKDLFEDYNKCKNYMVLDMVKDLWHHKKILGYEHMDFENIDLLNSWDFNKKVSIKINPNEKKYYLINDVDLYCGL